LSKSDSHPSFSSNEDTQHFYSINGEFAQILLFLIVTCGIVAHSLGFFEPTVIRYNCDAETVVNSRNGLSFSGSGVHFEGGKLQNNELAHSGQFSARLDKENPYAFGIDLPFPKGGEELIITAWKLTPGKSKKGALVLTVDKVTWESSSEVIEKGKEGWSKIQLKYRIPPEGKNKLARFYVWSQGNDEVYFDDLEIIIDRKPTEINQDI